MDKEYIRAKFIEKHPEYKRYSNSQLKLLQKRELRLAKKLKKINEIFELRYKNGLTLAEIGKRYSVRRQAIKEYLDHSLDFINTNQS